MKANAQSWVQVKDSSGRVVLQKTLAAGESIGAEGALPLSVIVGNASGTEVRVRGELLEVAKTRSEEHTSELQSQSNLVCRLLLEKKNTCQALLRTKNIGRSS